MIAKKPFGKSQYQSSRVIFGGASLGEADRKRAERAFESLGTYGVNHLDSSVSYGDADKRIGEQIAGNRENWTLAGKIDDRSYQEAWKEMEDFCRDLGIDQFDLLQMHELVKKGDVDTILRKDGAARVLLKAKEERLTELIGVTSHGYDAPVILKRCVEELPLDSVLLPWNYLLGRNMAYREAFLELRELCRDKGIAVQTIKSILHSSWKDLPHKRTTWYRPLEEQEDIDRAVWWILGHEDLFLCSPGDVDLLPRVLSAADRFTSAPADEEMEEMTGRLGMELPSENGWPRLW